MSNGWVDEKDYVPETGISSTAKYIGSGVLRTAARGFEELGGGLGSTVGFVGDILNTVKKGRVFGEKAGESFGLGEPLKKLPLPTRENIKNYVTEPAARALGVNIKPETKNQERYDEAVQDVVSFFNPTTGPVTRPAIALGLTAIGHAGKFFAEKLGANEGTQQLVKAGSMLGGSIAHSVLNTSTEDLIKRGKEYYNKSEETAKKLIAESPTKEILQQVPKVQRTAKEALRNVNKINKKSWGSAEDKAAGFLEGLLEDIEVLNGNLGIDQIPAYKQRINRSLYDLTAADKQAMEKYILPVKSSLIDSLEDMTKTYPQVAKPILEADQLYTAAHNLDRAWDNIKEATKGSGFKSGMTSYVLGQALGAKAGLAYAVVSSLFKVAKGVPGALQVTDIISKSPAAQRCWKQTFNAALRGNISQTARYARKLDEILKDEEDNGSSGWAPES